MKMQEIRKLGRKHGLTFSVGTTKVDAVRAIQKKEGNFDCFGRAGNQYCDQMDCTFYTECMKNSKQK